MKLWPFITKSHHAEVVGELKRQLSEMDAERKRIWDAYCASLGISPLFSPAPQIPSTPQTEESADESEAEVTGYRRPSQITAQESAKRQRAFILKHNPSAVAAAELDAAQKRGEAAARS